MAGATKRGGAALGGGARAANPNGVARSVAQNLIDQAHRAWGESPFYQARLKGPAPDRLLHRPDDPYSPDKAAGAALAAGRLSVGAETIDCEGELERAFDLAERDGALFGYLHRFEWLRACSALGAEGRAPAERLSRAWFERHERWSPESWGPSYAGDRLIHLCAYGGLLSLEGDALWRSRVLSSMARQTRHLAQAGHRAAAGYTRLTTAFALAVAGLCLPGCEQPMERGFELLRRELRLQLKPDGGHTSRNPSVQLEIVVRLQMVVDALRARRMAAPGFVPHMTGRAAGFLDLFRLGDGGLAVFNGGREDDPKALSRALASSDRDAAPVGFARHSGFQRLEAGRTVIVADMGAGAPSAGAHDGGGSFNFAVGRRRLVVNCGAGDRLGGDWARALRQADAHSTAVVEDAPGFAPARPRQRHETDSSLHRRAEDERGHLLELEREIALAGGAVRHVRRFFLSAGGDDLRGEDRFYRLEAGGAPIAWRVRFHLHPEVKASAARDGRSAVLALANQEGWRFRSNARAPSLERTVYCGPGGAPARSTQIVLSGVGLEPDGAGDIVVKWSFRRMGAALNAEAL